MAPGLTLQTRLGPPAGLATTPFLAPLHLLLPSSPDLAWGLPHPPCDSPARASLTVHPSPVGVADPEYQAEVKYQCHRFLAALPQASFLFSRRLCVSLCEMGLIIASYLIGDGIL